MPDTGSYGAPKFRVVHCLSYVYSWTSLWNKTFLGIQIFNSSGDFLNKLFSALQGFHRLRSGYGALRLVDKIVTSQPHPVKPGGEMLKIYSQTFGAEFNDSFMLIFSSRPISVSEHERPPGPEHGMISDRICPFLIYLQVRLCGTEITLSSVQIRLYLPGAEVCFFDMTLCFKALQIHCRPQPP